MKVIVAMLLLLPYQVVPSFSQPAPIGVFEANSDIGAVLNAGAVRYDPEDQSYTISGSGSNRWFDQDEFHFVWSGSIRMNFILSGKD